jgi:hypothetical protein
MTRQMREAPVDLKYEMIALEEIREGSKRTGRPKAAGQVKIGNRFQPM